MTQAQAPFRRKMNLTAWKEKRLVIKTKFLAYLPFGGGGGIEDPPPPNEGILGGSIFQGALGAVMLEFAVGNDPNSRLMPDSINMTKKQQQS